MVPFSALTIYLRLSVGPLAQTPRHEAGATASVVLIGGDSVDDVVELSVTDTVLDRFGVETDDEIIGLDNGGDSTCFCCCCCGCGCAETTLIYIIK
jgi:hypothetical protein